jgi:hypothetical protein
VKAKVHVAYVARQDSMQSNIPDAMDVAFHVRGVMLALHHLACALFMFFCPAANAIQVTLETGVDRGLQPTIVGSCNLPDGMLLIVRVMRKESAFQSESRVEVQGGQFKVGPLLQGSSNLNPGNYNIEVVNVPLLEQPDAVKAVIGNKGEELHGPLAKRIAGETRIRLFTTLEIGGPANGELDQARRDQVRLSETRWWRKNCTDICDGAERYTNQKGEPFDRPNCFKTCIANPPSVAR